MMLNSIRLYLASGAITLLLLGCDKPAPMSTNETATPVADVNTTAIEENTRISEFFQVVFDREIAQSPELQTILGLDTDDQNKWSDISDAAAQADVDEAQADLQTLLAFDQDALSADNKLSADLLQYQLQDTIDQAPFRKNAYIVDQFNGQVTDKVSLLLNAHNIETLKDAEDYIARIEGLQGVYSTMTTQLIDRAEFGVITPAFAYSDMLNDIGGLGKGAPIQESDEVNTLLIDFTTKVESLDVSDAQKAQLIERASAAISGPFKGGIDGLTAEIERQSTLIEGNNGVWSLPNGEAYYSALVKSYTTLNITAEEVHQLGLADVERIHAEMQGIMDTLDFEGSLQDFFEFVRTDPSNFYSNDDAGREAFLADAGQQTEEIFAVADQWFNQLPQAGLEVRRVEPWRENSTSIAFYQSPSLDGSRPGYYYANLKDMSTYQKSVSTAITYHEGVPGHHFQIALAQELTDLPDFRKHSFYGAYTEGWALYAERLAKDMGFYQDPMSDFGRLHDEIWRSARLVIDTGIHAKQWTREQAIDYFRQNTPLSEGDMVTEVERFFVTPGQALGYKMGMMKILELRARAQDQLGDDFDIRDFHDVVIGKGAMPLPILETQVDAYITAKQKHQ